MLFLVANLVLVLVILLFLRQLRRFQNQRHLARHLDFPPLLTPDQFRMLAIGFFLWGISLMMRLIQWKISQPLLNRLLELFFALIFTATTMFIVLGLMYFAAFPIREGRSAPSFRHIDLLQRVGLWVLAGAFLIGLFPGRPHFGCLVFLALWQLFMLAYTYFNLRYSENTLRGSVIVTLILWAAFSVFAWTSWWQFETLLLVSLAYFFQKASFLHTEDAQHRGESFRREVEVMISFLQKVTGADESLIEEAPEVDRWSGSLNLDRVLETTLNFSLGLTEASAGAIFLLQKYHPGEEGHSHGDIHMRARVVEGPYPPATDVSRLQHVAMRQRYLNELVLSERVPVQGSLIGRAIGTGETLFIPDAINDPTILQQSEDFLKIRSLLVVPLKVREEIVGAVSVINPKPGAFTEEDRVLLEAMAEQAAITIGSAVMHRELQEKERLEREMELASEVQRLLLPASTPDIPGFSFGAYGLAARQVGGDYYDFIWVDDFRLALVVADVSGKGVPGALTMAMVRSALRALSRHADGARDLLIRLNEFIAHDIRRDMFISMMIAVLNTETGQLEIARAGHDPLILLREGEKQPHLIQPDGIVLGLVGGQTFEDYTEEEIIDLEGGDIVVFYTDGITEAMNPDGQEYSLKRFLGNIIQMRHEDPTGLIEGVNKDLARFASGVPQHDDLTMLVLKVGPRRLQEVSAA
ncbi:MAG TPA: SpoIIE family protein phosphatase [bacterium]|nr:SpoIIE family protein phosphatase [bacterium]HQP98141.1 SpoIIE family protein phosphatase [bacterium]